MNIIKIKLFNNSISQLCLSGFVLFIVFFSFSKSFFNQVEYGVYPSYTESIVEDGDFNIVDEMFFPLQRIAVTKTFNYPNFHSHASSILLAPFYFYGLKLAEFWKLPEMTYPSELSSINNKKIKSLINQKGTKKHLTHMAMTACTCLLAVLSLLLTYSFCRKRFPKTKRLNIILLLSSIF